MLPGVIELGTSSAESPSFPVTMPAEDGPSDSLISSLCSSIGLVEVPCSLVGKPVAGGVVDTASPDLVILIAVGECRPLKGENRLPTGYSSLGAACHMSADGWTSY